MQELFFCEFTLTEYNQYKKDIMNKLRKAMIGAVLCALPLMASGQDIHWQARGGIGCSSVFAGVTNIKDRMGFQVGGGADIGHQENCHRDPVGTHGYGFPGDLAAPDWKGILPRR